MNSDKTESLEVKVAFLEESLHQLSDEYYRQQKELETLKKQFRVLFERLDSGGHGDNGDLSSEPEMPPHY